MQIHELKDENGNVVHACATAEASLKFLSPELRGIVLSDVQLPKMSGLDLLHHTLQIDPEIPVILVTAHGDVDMAVQAMRAGAYDFIEKPFAPERLVDIAARALEKRALRMMVHDLRRQLQQRAGVESVLLGKSPVMQQLRQQILNLADTSADVMVLGETGTGKELVARCLHDYSPRQAHRFVAINCGGLPETLLESELFGHEAGAFTNAQKRRIGKIEYADQGTLFLDEIESMPITMQIKLLRVLQERTLERLGSNTLVSIDCRVIAATKEDLLDLAARGGFRNDLYYRLGVATLTLPPLRERREDIRLLFEQFLLQAAARHQRPAPEISSGRIRQLVGYAWPGNVRELRNVADRCVLGIESGSPPFGQPAADGPTPLADTVEAFERALIADALRRHGSLARTAEALVVAKTTLHDKIRKYGLGEEDAAS